jgi:hypothetical protein
LKTGRKWADLFQKEDFTMSKKLLGGYELHREIGAEEEQIFKTAIKGLVGVDYKPVAVASQIVNGTNYVFICIGTPVVANPVPALYAVEIYVQRATSDIEVKDIEEIDIASLI